MFLIKYLSLLCHLKAHKLLKFLQYLLTNISKLSSIYKLSRPGVSASKTEAVYFKKVHDVIPALKSTNIELALNEYILHCCHATRIIGA